MSTVDRDRGQALDAFIHELAAELAYTDREAWALLDFDERGRYLELADCAVTLMDSQSAEGLAAIADVEAALRRIVGTEPMGRWLIDRLRDELSSPGAE